MLTSLEMQGCGFGSFLCAKDASDGAGGWSKGMLILIVDGTAIVMVSLYTTMFGSPYLDLITYPYT